MPEAVNKKKTRAQRSEENKAMWGYSPLNANVQFTGITETIDVDLSNSINIEDLSVNALRRIMRDGKMPAGRRFEAAEIVLGYELPPAALANSAVDPTKSEAYVFLKNIAQIEDAPLALRMRSLKVLAAIESARPKRIDPQDAERQRRREVGLVNAARRDELQDRGVWPCADRSWIAVVGDIIDFPDRLMDDVHAHTRVFLRSELLSVRIKNRPDPWDTLITRSADKT